MRMRVVRGRQATPSGAARITSTPRGKRAWFCFHCSAKWRGIGHGAMASVVSMPGPCSDSTLGRRQAVDLQDQRGRAVRIFLLALREILERDQLGRARHQREHRVGRRVGGRRAGMEGEIGADRGRALQRRIEPQRRVVIAKRQRYRRRHRRQRLRRHGELAHRRHGARPRHGVHHRLEHGLRVEHRIGKATVDRFGQSEHQSSPRTRCEEIDLGGRRLGTPPGIGSSACCAQRLQHLGLDGGRFAPGPATTRRRSPQAAPSSCRGRAHRNGRSRRRAAARWRG